MFVTERTMKLSLIAAAASLSMLLGVAHADNPMVGGAPMYVDRNIVENAVHSKDHTTLVAAVKAVGLVETLSGAGPFTVFCTDECRLRETAGRHCRKPA